MVSRKKPHCKLCQKGLLRLLERSREVAFYSGLSSRKRTLASFCGRTLNHENNITRLQMLFFAMEITVFLSLSVVALVLCAGQNSSRDTLRRRSLFRPTLATCFLSDNSAQCTAERVKSNNVKGVTTGTSCTYSVRANLVFLHEVDVGRALDLDRLAVLVVQRQHEVEEVGLAQVARRLLFKVRTAQPNTANIEKDIFRENITSQ